MLNWRITNKVKSLDSQIQQLTKAAAQPTFYNKSTGKPSLVLKMLQHISERKGFL